MSSKVRKTKLFNADYPQISLDNYFPVQPANTLLKKRTTPEGSEVTFSFMKGNLSKRKKLAPLGLKPKPN